jgi:16S rRNA (cytidine1402-2'-O)-methyltransferase
MKGIIYILPTEISDVSADIFFPAAHKELLLKLTFFAVENIRTARRFLKKVQPEIIIDELDFKLLNKDTSREEAQKIIKPALIGNSICIMSEAGAPGIADPGNILVQLAHENSLRVIPLVGPSSIFMALMASGMNGQNFAFTGYLPIKGNERISRIKELSKRAIFEKQSQIFMETPYRNEQLLADLILHADAKLKLCIALNITGDDEFIQTRKLKNWATEKPSLHKIPCIFILSA